MGRAKGSAAMLFVRMPLLVLRGGNSFVSLPVHGRDRKRSDQFRRGKSCRVCGNPPRSTLEFVEVRESVPFYCPQTVPLLAVWAPNATVHLYKSYCISPQRYSSTYGTTLQRRKTHIDLRSPHLASRGSCFLVFSARAFVATPKDSRHPDVGFNSCTANQKPPQEDHSPNEDRKQIR